MTTEVVGGSHVDPPPISFVSLGSLGVGARIYPFGLFCIVHLIPLTLDGEFKHETDDAGVRSFRATGSK